MSKVFELKENTHMVLKESDIVDHLTEAEQEILAILYEKIMTGRESNGKEENSYYIVNLDEPYADEILDVIMKGETSK